MNEHLDFSAVLTGEPRAWLLGGLTTTMVLSLCASLLATLLGGSIAGLRLCPWRSARWLGAGLVAAFRDTPLTVQLLFWYFGVFGLLPESLRDWLNTYRSPKLLGVTISVPSVEMLVAIWGLGLFGAAFIAEELRAGLRAIPPGQLEAAASQGFDLWQSLRFVLLPQAIGNAWQPIVGQYLNIMKLSSMAMAIGVAEISYQTRRVESFNLHAVEAFSVGTVLYLALGVALGGLMRAGGRRLFSRGRLPERG